MKTFVKTLVLLLVFITAMLSAGCSVNPSPLPVKPVVSIGAPAHGAQVNVGQEVLVQAIATDPGGISRVELWVDGALSAAALAPSPQPTQAAVLRWTPSTSGTHMLVARAVNVASVMSDPAAVTVNAVAQDPPAPPAPPPAPVVPTATRVPPSPLPAPCTNNAAFVQDVKVPDGTNWMPGQAFNKIWRVRNSGTCEWGPGYEFVFVGGEAMTTQASFVVPATAPGATTDLLVAMTAPTSPGPHAGQWRLRSAKSGLFGATLSASINVLSTNPPQPPQPPAPPPDPGCAGAPVIASFSANPTTITAGQSTTLNWGMVDNATSAVIDQGIGGIATPGNRSVNPAQTTTYTLTATGCGGTVKKQVKVTVNGQSGPAPSLTEKKGSAITNRCFTPVITSLSAHPSTLEVLPTFTGRTTLSWATKYADKIDVSPWIGVNSPSGSTTINIGKTVTYTFTAIGCGGKLKTTKQVTITVKPIILEMNGVTPGK